MKEFDIQLNPNRLVRFLKKPACEFTKNDIINFVEANNIEMLNFRYVAEDGRLKSLNFVINSREHLDTVLTTGERVDGSSLFSFIEAGSSDLYVVPRYKTAFINPFAQTPTLEIICSFYTSKGEALESAPEYILKKAHRIFKEKTGLTFKALGELEYYVESEKPELYPGVDQKGYHEAEPFTQWEQFRVEAMQLIAETGAKIKYGHSEVGNFSTEEKAYEQHEIEFLPVDVEDAADQLIVAKWILRMLASQYGVRISFAPKITVGKAGSGLHIHMLAEKDGKNMMVENDKLSPIARKMIAGMLDLAEAITAFGNTIPTSYLRLVPHQEAPTNICWGDRNRSVLVRVPLGWLGTSNMIYDVNPQEPKDDNSGISKQTVEFRAPDGSADIYLLLAGLVVSCQHGLEMDNALEIAEKLYVDVNIFDDEHKDKVKDLKQLPDCCWDSAIALDKKRKYFEKEHIFPAGTIDGIVNRLKCFDDKDMSERLYGNGVAIKKIVDKHFHC